MSFKAFIENRLSATLFFFPARSIWLKQKKKLSCLSLKEVISSANQL